MSDFSGRVRNYQDNPNSNYYARSSNIMTGTDVTGKYKLCGQIYKTGVLISLYGANFTTNRCNRQYRSFIESSYNNIYPSWEELTFSQTGISFYYDGYPSPYTDSDGVNYGVVMIDLPVFDSTESLQNYIDTGDFTGAVNYADLTESKANAYLSYNGKTIRLTIEPQVNKISESLNYDSVYVYNSNKSFNRSVPTQGTVSFTEGDIFNLDVLSSTTLFIEFLKNGVSKAVLSAKISKKVLGLFGSVSVDGLVTDSGGYLLYTSTDNQFDEIAENIDIESDASDNPSDGSEFGGFNTLCSTFQISKTALTDLGSFIWRNSLFDDIKQWNTSPLSNIVSLHYMPCDIPGTNSKISFGNIDTNISGQLLSQNMQKVRIGNIAIPSYNTGFLNYEPYSSFSLYLPLIGSVSLSCKDVIGYNLIVDYIWDVVVGSFGVLVYTTKGGGMTLIYSATGTCNIDIPLTSSNRSQLQSAIFTAGVDVALGNVTNVGSVVNESLGIMNINQDSQKFNAPSSMTGAVAPDKCFYVMRTPAVYLPSTFAHSHGYICMSSYQLSQLSGYTEIENIDLSNIVGYRDEIEELQQLLSNGVYF